MAVFLRQDRGFDPSGSRQLPIKESDIDQCSVSLRQMSLPEKNGHEPSN